MKFTALSIMNLGRMLAAGKSVLLLLCGCTAILPLIIGRREKWNVGDSLPLGFITATTVGHGDPGLRDTGSKVIAGLIALLDLTTTGIAIALALDAATRAYDGVTLGR